MLLIIHVHNFVKFLQRRKLGQILIYLSLDVFTWLQYRKFCGRPDLQRVGNYVVATSADQQDFDKFCDSPFYKDRPLLKTDVLIEFMKLKKLPIEFISEHVVQYVINFQVLTLMIFANGAEK